MTSLQYQAPDSIDEAVAMLANADNARVLAGGTDLLVQMRAGMAKPGLIVDIKNIAELREVVEEDGGFRVGAAVAGAELAEHPSFPDQWPGVLEGFELIGSTQIQGRASMGGNLCNASPAADSVPAMVAAGAIANIVGPNGRRQAPVGEIPTGPGKTSLAKGEMVVSISFPARPARASDAYLRFIPRTEMDIAVVGCGVNLVLDGDTIKEARVALGAVAPTVLLVEDAAKAIIGSSLDDAALARLDAAAQAAAKPITDKRGTVEFRTKVAGVLARRTAAIAYERART